jgi:hypothetical protein
MQKFFLHNGTEQQGPFDLNELKTKGITKDTPIWYDGLPEWKAAHEIVDLMELFKVSGPPPFEKKQIPPPFEKVESPPVIPKFNQLNQTVDPLPKKNSGKRFLIGIVVVVLIVLSMMIANNPNIIPAIKVQVNSPKPKVISQRIEDISSIFKEKWKVIALIQNQGGDGNVLVTFQLFQNGNSFDKTKEIPLKAGESLEVSEEFDEMRRLDGEFSYEIAVK